MYLSYAQLMEDVHLELVLGDRASGTYVDVGAGHPVADNVSYHFYLRGWRGIVVEPQAELASLYGAIRPRDRVIDHLIGRFEKEVDFHRVERLHGFSTMIEANAASAMAFGARYRTERKCVRPLAAIIDEADLGAIDFLKVDVEGAEADVLAGMDWRRHRPVVLCIEAIKPGSGEASHEEWEDILAKAAYSFAFFDGLNRFYLAQEHAGLASRFPSEPLRWDSVRHLYEFGHAHQEPSHPDHALADRLIRGFLAGLPGLDATDLLALLERSAGPGGPEKDEALRTLIGGTFASACPGQRGIDSDEGGTATKLLDDHARAALGRIAAAYDGGMLWDQEG